MPQTNATMKDANTLGNGFVLVGRGKVCYKHSGNQYLAKMVQSVLGAYSDRTATKKSKTELIKNIVHKIKESTPEGGFVKFDKEAECWYEVDDRVAREKVSQTFRDALTDTYKSSTTSKALRRRQERINRQSKTGTRESQDSTRSSQYSSVSASLPSGEMPLRDILLPACSVPPSLWASLAPKAYQNKLGRAGESSCLQLAIAIAERKRSLQNLILGHTTLGHPIDGLNFNQL